MKKLEITINNRALPCRVTMGAMLRFRNETGKEVTDINPASISDLCIYLYCCIVSACKCDGVEFNMTLIDFADSIHPDDMAAWAESIAADAADAEATSEEKKSSK